MAAKSWPYWILYVPITSPFFNRFWWYLYQNSWFIEFFLIKHTSLGLLSSLKAWTSTIVETHHLFDVGQPVIKLFACWRLLSSSAKYPLQTVWNQIRTDRTSLLIWIQTAWHSDCSWKIFFEKSLKKSACLQQIHVYNIIAYSFSKCYTGHVRLQDRSFVAKSHIYNLSNSLSITQYILASQGSYRQDFVKFKDF